MKHKYHNVKLIKYYADWCGPCKAITPIVESVVEELNLPYEARNIDDSENAAKLDQCGIRGIPAMILISEENGQERIISSLVGMEKKDAIVAWINKYI